MNIHEYQSKQVLKSYGVNVPEGFHAVSVEEAVECAAKLTTGKVVVKAQIHAGGRGKGQVKGGTAHGVTVVDNNADAVREAASAILGKVLVTHQTGPDGKQVNNLLIEAGADIKKEYYLSFVVDRQTAQVVMMASTEGGMEIEKVAAETPEKIFKEYIDAATGLLPFQTSRMAFKLGLPKEAVRPAQKLMGCLYNAFVGKDCSLAEINPMVLTGDNNVMALDAKLNFDDSALFRHPDIVELRDESEEDPKELEAAAADLNYVNLGGDVACMVNGAGLAMATVDIIKYFGGEPANFLDVGGDSAPEKIAKAFNIMLEGGQAKGIFVNIFGGINRCDQVAQGILKAAELVSEDGKSMPVPVMVRLEGTNAEQGREILKNSPINNVFMAPTMEGGAEEIVKLVKKAEA